MQWTEGFKYILSAIAGGGLASFLTFRIALKKQNLSEFQTLVNTYKDLANDLQHRVEDLEKELIRIKSARERSKEEIISLRNQLQLFESSHLDIPLPMWMKANDKKHTMLFVNNNYEEMFLKPKGLNIADYIGYTDYDVWSKEIADNFQKLDNQVIRGKRPVKSVEKLEDEDGHIYYCEVLKYPRFVPNSTKVLGISGIVLRTAETKEELDDKKT